MHILENRSAFTRNNRPAHAGDKSPGNPNPARSIKIGKGCETASQNDLGRSPFMTRLKHDDPKNVMTKFSAHEKRA
jgi:hypothetical protein